jgi:hypothetical protein
MAFIPGQSKRMYCCPTFLPWNEYLVYILLKLGHMFRIGSSYIIKLRSTVDTIAKLKFTIHQLTRFVQPMSTLLLYFISKEFLLGQCQRRHYVVKAAVGVMPHHMAWISAKIYQYETAFLFWNSNRQMASLHWLKFGGTCLHWPKPSDKSYILLKKTLVRDLLQNWSGQFFIGTAMNLSRKNSLLA